MVAARKPPMEETMKSYFVFLAIILFFGGMFGCSDDSLPEWQGATIKEAPKSEYGGAATDDFKIPVGPGYDWEISQSWASHCSECNTRYSDWDYCDLSHQGTCCRHGWDFNLTGYADQGRDVLSTGDGYVRERGKNSAWGNYVLLDHGNNVCSRYAHMLDGTTDHLSDNQFACQGLKIGEIGNTGASEGPHLHFQFEDCEDGNTLPMAFTDGNDVPMCTRGDDRYDSNGNYTALLLTNERKRFCRSEDPSPEENESAWVPSQCGALDGCPLRANCNRSYSHDFTDESTLTRRVKQAASYLWGECSLDGKSDGGLHPHDSLTRAEALKIPLFLFGLMDQCTGEETEPFVDVGPEDWYRDVVACAVSHRIINYITPSFNPDEPVSFVEAAKFAVESAHRAELIFMVDPASGHFANISRSHWGYHYVETVYSYGGHYGDTSEFEANDHIERGDYSVMVASLSPCFCGNVSCGEGCICNQGLMACVDMGEHSSGDQSRGEDSCDDEEPTPARGSADERPGSRSEDNNDDPTPVRGSDDERPASSSDDPAEEPAVNEDQPWDGGAEPLVTWNCNPDIGHVFRIDSPGGEFEIMMSGPRSYSSLYLGPGVSSTIYFECEDLPASVLIHGGGEYVHVWIERDDVAPFEVWTDWEGPQVIHPREGADSLMRNYFAAGPGREVLIRVAPAE